VAGVGGGPWRALWEAARGFACAHDEAWPPEGDRSSCPLCLQDLTAQAGGRLAAFERFVSDDVNRRLRAARACVEARRAALPDVAALRSAHAQALEALAQDEGRSEAALARWLAAAAQTVEAVRAAVQPEGVAEPPPVAAIEAFITGRRREIERLAALEEPREQARLQTLVEEWQARSALAARSDEAVAHVTAAAHVARLRELRDEAGTQGISLRIGQLSGSFVQAELRDGLERQLHRLAFSSPLEVVLDSHVSRGTPWLGLKLLSAEGVPLAEVLSGGAQRRLALAMCLAEMSVGHPGSPLILDDPVCSIDQEGRRHVARELAALVGAERQVIVFTHDLSFAVELRAAADRADIPFHAQHLVREPRTTGHVRPHLPWEGLKARERIEPLQSKLADARAYHGCDDEAYAMRARDFCVYLRQGYERLVEDEILAGTVTRREVGVRPASLGDVVWSEDVVRLVDRGIGENSRLLHAAAPAEGSIPPTPDELRGELDRYRDLLDLVRRKRKERAYAASRSKNRAAAVIRDADSDALRPKLRVVPPGSGAPEAWAERPEPGTPP
jgi:hypothetical protein